jgi:hypothetical protein
VYDTARYVPRFKNPARYKKEKEKEKENRLSTYILRRMEVECELERRSDIEVPCHLP